MWHGMAHAFKSDTLYCPPPTTILLVAKTIIQPSFVNTIPSPFSYVTVSLIYINLNMYVYFQLLELKSIALYVFIQLLLMLLTQNSNQSQFEMDDKYLRCKK
jgi:hypothetical protein